LPEIHESSFLSEILGSKTKLKIIIVLLRYEHAGITRIAREAGLNHAVAKKGIDELKRSGIVVEEYIGPYKVYKLDRTNPVVRLLKDLLRAIGSDLPGVQP